jgi:hypothetical protein
MLIVFVRHNYFNDILVKLLNEGHNYQVYIHNDLLKSQFIDSKFSSIILYYRNSII